MNKPLAFISDKEFFQTLGKLPNKHTPKVATAAGTAKQSGPRPSPQAPNKWRG